MKPLSAINGKQENTKKRNRNTGVTISFNIRLFIYFIEKALLILSVSISLFISSPQSEFSSGLTPFNKSFIVIE